MLEPSAGTGALIRALPPGCIVEAVEINRRLADGLTTLTPRVVCADFLSVKTWEMGERFRYVLMNPPFENGSDVKHILRAREYLAPGGILVAICAAGPRQHEALQPWADSWEYLEPGTFEGTGVRAVLLTYRAP